ncbi:MAG TPA: hypothetical protein VG455_10935 [Acidimicrobiales bacterium]|nr:hypothetical protein [Acidimicrobiales bacterium]
MADAAGRRRVEGSEEGMLGVLSLRGMVEDLGLVRARNAVRTTASSRALGAGRGGRAARPVARRGWGRRHVAALAVFSASIALGSCTASRDDALHRAAPPTTPVARTGEDITVAGRITRTFGAHVIQLGSASREPLIVVLRRAEPVFDGQRVAVSGDVRTFRRAELESELAVDLGSETVGLEGQRCLLADSVRFD